MPFSSNTETYLVTRAKSDGTTSTGSGRDLMSSGQTYSSNTGRIGYWGRSGLDPERWVLAAKDGSVPNTENWNGVVYSTGYNSSFSFAKSGTVPDGYDPVEDFSRFEYGGISTGANSSYRLNPTEQGVYELNQIGSGSYTNQGSIPSGYDQTFPSGTVFLIPLMDDTERDSIYVENHGFNTGQTITIDTTAGSAPIVQSIATNLNSSPVFETLADPVSVQVERVNSNRIRIRRNNTTQRLRATSGSYNLVRTGDNPTRNSIYFPEHGFSTGQVTTIEAGSGGVLPTLSTSTPTPTLDGDIALSVFNATKEALDSVRTAMGSDVVNLYINGTAASLPFVRTQSTVAGGTYDFSYGINSLSVAFSSGLFNSSVSLPAASSWSQELPYDILSNTEWAGFGFNLIQSRFQAQQEAPYWITLVEIPGSADIGGGTSEVIANFNSSIGTMPYSASATGNDNSTANWTSLSSGWRYTHDGIYYRPADTASGRHGFFSVSLIVDNSNYTGYLSSYSQNIQTSTLHSVTSGQGGQRYLINIIMPIKAGSASASTKYGTTSGSIATVNSIASTIANTIVTNLTAPAYSVGPTDAFVKVVSANRFALRNSNFVPFNFTGSGTAPLTFNLGTTAGALDGSYEILEETPYSFSLLSSVKVPKRVVPLTNTNVSNVNNVLYFNVTNHSLDFGQAIVFNLISGSLTGLTDGQTYYAIPADANYFAIATSLENAQQKIPINVAAPVSGSYSFTVNSVNGLIPRNGTVQTVTGSKLLTGTGDTFFKQFFKDGDYVFVVDTTTAPGIIKELRIASVVSDTLINLTEPANFSSSSAKFFTRTAIYMRPDGTFLHRPFDGGVEITAGSSPNSSITRQTRKYFRYQSGKGIQCSIAINFNPARLSLSVESSGTTATVTTKTPHGLKANDQVIIRGSLDNAYNGTFNITTATEFSFQYELTTTPVSSVPAGIIEYVPTGWANAAVRCGMFDDQNGFFYEYDGSDLYAVRRASVQQLSGTVAVQNGKNVVIGTDTNFLGQLNAGDKIVIRGQSYKVTAIEGPTGLHIQPTYRGTSQQNVVVTKTTDVRVPQSEWNLDKADGTGPSGFNLDITRIQMVYMDYSWYGAGKIRFGFKDNKGKVRYFHEFIHNNKLNEAYMRSGNLPARYQIENIGTPTYVPTLFHWGTSIIMDGQFDDDKAYLFTASSNSLNYSAGTAVTANTAAASSLVSYSSGPFTRERDWYVKIPFSTADASKFTSGIQLYSTNLTGQSVVFTDYADGRFNAYIFISRSRTQPSASAYPSVPSGETVNLGAPSGGSSADLDLLKAVVPIVTIRLAPSVDNNLTGAVGQRDIINRMQLQLKQLGITTSHDCNIQLILNGSMSSINYEPVQSPSLSQLIIHEKGDTIVGGVPIFSLRASGGNPDANGRRLSNTVDFDLSQISDLGNSILGGDGVFPNGPDILTIAAQIIDTAEVTSVAPFRVGGRLTWTESQA